MIKRTPNPFQGYTLVRPKEKADEPLLWQAFVSILASAFTTTDVT
jgi:hypothetical protein